MSEIFNAKFWEEIKEKYPKSYIEYIKYILNKVYNCDLRNYQYKNHVESDIDTYCYCDIEKFFIKQHNLFIEYKFLYDPHVFRFDYIIIDIMNNKILGKCNKEVDYDEVQIEAIKQAFEILNNQLENEK